MPRMMLSSPAKSGCMLVTLSPTDPLSPLVGYVVRDSKPDGKGGHVVEIRFGPAPLRLRVWWRVKAWWRRSR